MELYQKSIEINLKCVFPTHSNSAVAYSNIGEIYAKQGDEEGALTNFSKALKIEMDSEYRRDDIRIKCYRNIGRIFYRQ